MYMYLIVYVYMIIRVSACTVACVEIVLVYMLAELISKEIFIFMAEKCGSIRKCAVHLPVSYKGWKGERVKGCTVAHLPTPIHTSQKYIENQHCHCVPMPTSIAVSSTGTSSTSDSAPASSPSKSHGHWKEAFQSLLHDYPQLDHSEKECTDVVLKDVGGLGHVYKASLWIDGRKTQVALKQMRSYMLKDESFIRVSGLSWATMKL